MKYCKCGFLPHDGSWDGFLINGVLHAVTACSPFNHDLLNLQRRGMESVEEMSRLAVEEAKKVEEDRVDFDAHKKQGDEERAAVYARQEKQLELQAEQNVQLKRIADSLDDFKIDRWSGDAQHDPSAGIVAEERRHNSKDSK